MNTIKSQWEEYNLKQNSITNIIMHILFLLPILPGSILYLIGTKNVIDGHTIS